MKSGLEQIGNGLGKAVLREKIEAAEPVKDLIARDLKSSRRRYALGLLAGLLAVGFSLELLVRFLVMGPGLLFAPDANIGKVVVKGTRVFWGTEGYGRTEYVRDGEIATPFTGGPVIVVLGDSHTEAYQVNDEAKFVSVAEKILRSRGGIVDLRNLGFSGGTMADYVQLGPSIISRYQPVAVVIQLTAADFGAESFDAKRVNYFVRAANGSLLVVHRNAPVGSPSLGSRLKHASALLNYLQVRYLTIAEQRGRGTLVTPEASAAAPEGAERETVPAQLDLLQHAYAGIPVILLVLPTVPRIESGGISSIDPAYEQFLRRIRISLSGAPSWHVVDPLPAFRELARHDELARGFLNTRPGSGHLNVIGHRVVGQLLADAIENIQR